MKKKELEKIVSDRKEAVRKQNEKAKENWETVSCRLPKGTKERITSKGLTVNGLINALVIAELDRIEKNNK